MKRIPLYLAVLLIITFALSCGAPETPKDQAALTPSEKAPVKVEAGPKTKVELWVMSQCPFGTGAESALNKVAAILGPRLGLSIRFVLDNKKDGEGFESLHGPAEVELDMMQACAASQAGDKLLPFIDGFNLSEDPWPKVAADFGLDVSEIEKCMKDGRGAAILTADAKESETRKITSSPTLILNDEEYDGPRSSHELFKAVCKTFDKAGRPSICADPPETLSWTDGGAGKGKCGGDNTPEVPADLVDDLPFVHTVIYDPQALSDNIGQILEQTQKYFPKATINKVDYNSKEGKALIEKFSIAWIPAYLFPADIAKAKNFSQLSQVLRKSKDGEMYMLDPRQVGANVNLDKVKKTGQLTVFYSPFAPRSLGMILDINSLLSLPKYAEFKNKIQYMPHGMLDSSGQMKTQGGMPEADELARHEAILEIAPDKFIAYLTARKENPHSSYWEDFVKSAGLDPETVKKKATSSATSAKLIANSKEAQLAGAGPAFDVLIENRELARVGDKEEFQELLDKLLTRN